MALSAAAPPAGAVPPTLTKPGDISAEATSSSGAVVAFAVTASDPTASVTCTPPSNSLFPFGQTAVVCTAIGSSGEGSSASFAVYVSDTTAPTFSQVPKTLVFGVNGVRGAVARYLKPVARDVVDGPVPVNCTPASGAAFPLGDTEVVCSATDAHQNVGTVSFPIRILDKVPPPSVTDVVVRRDGGLVTLTWRLPHSQDVAGAEVVRFPGAAVVYRGFGAAFTDHDVQAKASYHYIVFSYDWANNRSPGVIVLAAASTSKLTQPQDGAALTGPPMLTWQQVSGADYYNVQLWAVRPGGPVKVFTIWPNTNHLQLPRTWTYAGKKHQLTKGSYRWYVWPGLGPLAKGHYGKLLGASGFVIVG